MKTEKLMPLIDTVRNLRTRRSKFLFTSDDWFTYQFPEGTTRAFRSSQLLPWIEQSTTRPFFLNASSVAFKLEQDMMIFKLGYQKNG